MDNDDPVARLRAEVDQHREGMKELAKALWTFYSELQEEGFDSAGALILTVEYLRTMMASARGGE